MLKRLFTLSLLFTLLVGNNIFSQTESVLSNGSNIRQVKVEPTVPPIEATWDVQFNYDAVAVTGAAGNAGAVYIPTINKFWTSRWATGVIHQWNADGTLDQTYTLPFTGTRGMVFDGQFVYHSINTTAVQIVDPATRTVVGTIPVTGAPNGARFIAYNPDGDGGNSSIIVGNWTAPNLNFYEFSMTGTLLRTITNAVTGVYGIAYDKWSPGGPFLWVWGQGSGAGTPQIIQQMDYTTGVYTGVQHDVVTDIAPGIAGGLFIASDIVPGFVTLGGMLQGDPGPDRFFGYELTTSGSLPCPVVPSSNPTPANGTTGVSITSPGNLSWTNGAGTTNVEVFFGQAGNVQSVYSGTPITTWAIPAPLTYNKIYQWRVVCKNDTCSAPGTATWSFTTELNPNVLFEDFFADFSQWTAVGPLGTTNWATSTSASAGGVSPELRMSWTPSFNGESRIRSTVINAPNSTELHFDFRMFLDWFADPSGVLTFDATYDGGATRTNLWTLNNPTGNVGPGEFSFDFMSPAAEAANLQLELSFTGNSFNIDYIYFDNMQLTFVVPVELTSFAATSDNNNVNLNWSTATELNNSGFQIERSINGVDFQNMGFVAGHGTTTDIHNYSYVDQNVRAGNYTYRLKQIDFDGTFEYSNAIEVEVIGLKEFSLGQNYPNPFNPSTKISFSLAVDSKVSLKVFDVLGQEVATLVNGQLTAGSQEVSFNASSLNSGVYFYRIDADGIDGQKYSSVKKMILTK